MLDKFDFKKEAGRKLTVIIRDDSPLIHCNDSPSYRRVTIGLTVKQRKELMLKVTHQSGDQEFYEEISKCFIDNFVEEV